MGGTVGYQIRLESRCSAATKLLYCTTGVLLRKLQQTPTHTQTHTHQALEVKPLLGDGRDGGSGSEYLDSISHIIIDEIHERQVSIYIIFVCICTFLFSSSVIVLILSNLIRLK